jgi:RNase P subunit RPR2
MDLMADAIPCVQCEKDLRSLITRACLKKVVVYRMERSPRLTEGEEAESVFVECPYCGKLHEYACPLDDEEAR